jgi:hypothetical protein
MADQDPDDQADHRHLRGEPMDGVAVHCGQSGSRDRSDRADATRKLGLGRSRPDAVSPPLIAARPSRTSYSPCRRPLDGVAGRAHRSAGERGVSGATTDLDWMHC